MKAIHTDILTIPTKLGNINCYVTPCIGISLCGSSREYYSTSYAVYRDGKYVDTYDKSIWMYEGIDSKGRTLKMKSGFPLGALFADLEFKSPADAKKQKATIKMKMEQVIEANNWKLVDSQS